MFFLLFFHIMKINTTALSSKIEITFYFDSTTSKNENDSFLIPIIGVICRLKSKMNAKKIELGKSNSAIYLYS